MAARTRPRVYDTRTRRVHTPHAFLYRVPSSASDARLLFNHKLSVLIDPIQASLPDPTIASPSAAQIARVSGILTINSDLPRI
jgi:hypothetical protein